MPLTGRVTKDQAVKEVARLEEELKKAQKAVKDAEEAGTKDKPLDLSFEPDLEVHVYAAVELSEDRDREKHTFQVIRNGEETELRIADISKAKSAIQRPVKFKTQELIEGIKLHHDRHFRSLPTPKTSPGVKVSQPEIRIENGNDKIVLVPPTEENQKNEQTLLQINNSQPLLFREIALLRFAELLEKKMVVKIVD